MPGSAEAYAFLDLALAGLAGHAPRVIGGQALTAYGLPRSTVDIDLIVANRIVLTRAWPPSEDLEVRAATELDDPLDGVVEWWPEDGDPRVPVQVIVLDRPWLRPLLERPGVPVILGGRSLIAVDPVAFIALKLYAGGPRDRADLELLATHPRWPEWRRALEAVLASLPPASVKRWARWRPGEPEPD